MYCYRYIIVEVVVAVVVALVLVVVIANFVDLNDLIGDNLFIEPGID